MARAGLTDICSRMWSGGMALSGASWPLETRLDRCVVVRISVDGPRSLQYNRRRSSVRSVFACTAEQFAVQYREDAGDEKRGHAHPRASCGITP